MVYLFLPFVIVNLALHNIPIRLFRKQTFFLFIIFSITLPYAVESDSMV